MKYKIELISNLKSIINILYLFVSFPIESDSISHLIKQKSQHVKLSQQFLQNATAWLEIKSGGKSGIKSSYFYKIQVGQWLNSWSRYDYYSISWQLRIFMDLLFWPILWIFSGYSKNFCLTGLKTIECMNVIWKLFPADIEIITT